MFEKLPPKEGLNNRISRFVLQALDKILYPNSDAILSGGSQSPWSPTTRRELNKIASENDMRRYPGAGEMSPGGHHAATDAYKGIAAGTMHAIEPKIIGKSALQFGKLKKSN